MIIGLTGRIAAGKGFVIDVLKENGFEYVTVSTLIKEEAAKRGIKDVTREILQDIGNEIRDKDGAGAWMKMIALKFDLNKNYIIDGVRNPGEVSELKKLPDFYLISIDSPFDLRYERVIKRGKPSDPKTIEEFKVLDDRDFREKDAYGQQVGECMKLGDFHLINDGSFDDFRKKIMNIFSKLFLK